MASAEESREPHGEQDEHPDDPPVGEEGSHDDSGSAVEVSSEAAESPVEDEIETLTAELEELRDRHLRLAAEFDNFRKRTTRERAQYAERAQAELVRELLEPLDDLTRFSELGDTEPDASALLEGVQLVERKLRNILGQGGLQEIEAAGSEFDPELHDALTTVRTDDPEQDGIVAQELARGYMFKNTLLRPALVAVKKYEEASDDEPDESDADEAADTEDS